STGCVHDGHGVAGRLAEGHAAGVRNDCTAGAEGFLRIATTCAGAAAEHRLLLGADLVTMVDVERQVGRVRAAADWQAGIHEQLVVVTAELGTAAADRNAVRQSPEPIVV